MIGSQGLLYPGLLAQGDLHSNYLHHFPSRLVADVLQSPNFEKMLPSFFYYDY